MLKNPLITRQFELPHEQRPTLSSVSKRMGVSPRTVWKWFNHGITPRPHHLASLARQLSCTQQEALSCIKRSHKYAVSHNNKLPYGLIIHSRMFTPQSLDTLSRV